MTSFGAAWRPGLTRLRREGSEGSKGGRPKGAKGRGWRRRLCRRVVFAFAHGALPQAAFITPSEPARSAGRTRRSARQRTDDRTRAPQALEPSSFWEYGFPPPMTPAPLQCYRSREIFHPLSFFVVEGFNHDFILIEVDGVGPHLFSVPGGIVHIKNFSVVVVHFIGKGGLGGRRMGMAGHPQFHLGTGEEDEVYVPGGLGEVPGISYFVVVGNHGVRQRRMVENEGGGLAVFFQGLPQPFHFFFRHGHRKFTFRIFGGEENEEVLPQLLCAVEGPEDLFIIFLMGLPKGRVRHHGFAVFQFFFVEELMVSGQVRFLPGKAVDKLFCLFHLLHGAVHFYHVTGEHLEVHIGPAVDILPGLHLIVNDGLPFRSIHGFRRVMEVGNHNDSFILLLRGRRLLPAARKGQTGKDQEETENGTEHGWVLSIMGPLRGPGSEGSEGSEGVRQFGVYSIVR